MPSLSARVEALSRVLEVDDGRDSVLFFAVFDGPLDAQTGHRVFEAVIPGNFRKPGITVRRFDEESEAEFRSRVERTRKAAGL